MKRLLLLLLPLGMAVAQQPIPSVAPIQRTISVSQQFVIYKADRAARGWVARKAEDLKADWLERLKADSDWDLPIIIQLNTLRPPNTPRIATNIFEADGGAPKIQIDVYDPLVLKSSDFDLEVFRALALELAYRKLTIKAGKSIQRPPAWLIEGLHEDMVAREDGVPVDTYKHLIETSSVPKLDTFLKQRPEMMDATSHAIYRALSMGLLRALLDSPDGAKHLRDYVANLPNSNPADAKQLLAQFPELGADPTQLNKLWTLAIARASATDRVDSLGIDETRKKLDLILDITSVTDPKKPKSDSVTGPTALLTIGRTESGRYTLRQVIESLLRLEVRAHPLFRPIIEEYRLIATELAARPKKNMEKRLAENIRLQEVLQKRMAEMTDYLNWFDATQMSTPSQAFQNVGEREEMFSSMPPRNDAVSRYLDDLEASGW